ncbi:MAG: hypothetical protein U9N50_06320 [Pseudomonadota bacterium]|nr:hypothetical protein [Pseudomonadota bacterium]
MKILDGMIFFSTHQLAAGKIISWYADIEFQLVPDANKVTSPHHHYM